MLRRNWTCASSIWPCSSRLSPSSVQGITYDTLWRVDDPLKTVAPIVQGELQKRTGQSVPIAPAAAYDPMNYQGFAVTDDGVMFFFSQGQLLPEAVGATQVLVPRAAIDPMLA